MQRGGGGELVKGGAAMERSRGIELSSPVAKEWRCGCRDSGGGSRVSGAEGKA